MKLFRIVFWDMLPCKMITHPWWWRQNAPLKRRSTIILHCSISQKTILNIIPAAVRTWNLTSYETDHLWTNISFWFICKRDCLLLESRASLLHTKKRCCCILKSASSTYNVEWTSDYPLCWSSTIQGYSKWFIQFQMTIYFKFTNTEWLVIHQPKEQQSKFCLSPYKCSMWLPLLTRATLRRYSNSFHTRSSMSFVTRGHPVLLPLHKHPVSSNCRYHRRMLWAPGGSVP
jgi:hypothetical protein